VLEHIEPDYLDKVLADGRNAHINQLPTSWWLPKLCERFEIVHLQRSPGGFWVVTEPRAADAARVG
jgi:hypothetical protein